MINEYKYFIHDGERRDMSLFGAFSDDGAILFRLVFENEPKIISVDLVIHSDGLGNGGRENYMTFGMNGASDGSFEVTVGAKDLSALSPNGLLFYKYEVRSEVSSFSLGGEEVTRLLGSVEYGERQLLIYDSALRTPDFIKGGEIYHIFVDRFATSGKYPVKDGAKLHKSWDEVPEYAPYRGAPIANNDFFGGDLTGAADKLDYIESLGVTTVYLSPVFESVSNHKYDTADYMKVDSMFGGDAALEDFIKKCRLRGIDVILDGVFNHTGDDSVYFDRYGKYGGAGAYCTKESPYFDWYNFRDYPDDYECWWGIKILPRVNCSCESFRKHILGDGGVVEKYMRMGVSGFRLDVADELSDLFLDELRKKVKSEKEDSVILGEVWEDASNKISYSDRRRYLSGRQLDSVMNYPLRSGVISFIKYGDHETLRRALETVYRHYPKDVSDSLMNFLGTHDTDRIITVLAGEPDDGKSHAELAAMRMTARERSVGRSLVKCAWAIVATAYGVPSIFYGDEAGLEGYHDPFCRMPFPWGREDEQLEHFYKKMGSFRKSEPLFKDGLFRVVHSSPEAFVTERFSGDGSVFTVVTRERPFVFIPGRTVKCVLDSDTDDLADCGLAVPPYTARIFIS